MEAEAEILEPLELPFSDLLLCASSSGVSPSSEEVERLESLSGRVMEALGSSGPGLLCVTGVPKAAALRQALLPLARKLALLGGSDRARILKSHGLGTDVPLKNPDRTVSSFAKQLKYMRDPDFELNSSFPNEILKENTKDAQNDFHDIEFNKLGNAFEELGFCMMEVGLRLAQLCDRKMGCQELELSILESCTAKGRLIHYHSTIDNIIIKESKKRMKKSSTKPGRLPSLVPHGSTPFGSLTPLNSEMELQKQQSSHYLNGASNAVSVGHRTSLSDLWQQWHYDYGIFTVLTTPMFLCLHDTSPLEVNDPYRVSNTQECSSPDGRTCLQLFDSANNKILMVKAPPESFIVQVGESADILSHGNLCSTLHSVCRPVELDSLSRETFVVFLQPAWDKTFSVSEILRPSEKQSQELTSREAIHKVHNEKAKSNDQLLAAQDEHNLKEEILKAVPPLYSRITDGMTFAEFSRETTKQYYGGSGTQSRR